MNCPVGIHHGPGHQSTTKCNVEGSHEIHETFYGSYGQYASWKGGDVFTGYFDEPPDEDNPEYVSDTKWYQDRYEYYSTIYMPKDYK
jgi:hypothetical protein